jgi:hypothetical protein
MVEINLATLEAPWEGLVWVFKTVVSQSAGYTVSADHALRVLARWAPGSPPVAEVLGLSRSAELKSLPEPVHCLQKLDDCAADIALRKGRTFNRRLAELDAKIQTFRRGKGKVPPYVASFFPVPSQAPAVLRPLLEAYRTESMLDFAGLERERTQLVRVLLERANDAEIQEVLRLSQSLKEKAISYGSYFRHVRQLATAHGIDFSRWPLFCDYLHYVELSESLNTEQVSEAIWDVEQAEYEARCVRPEERALHDEDDRVYQMRRLFMGFAGAAKRPF